MKKIAAISAGAAGLLLVGGVAFATTATNRADAPSPMSAAEEVPSSPSAELELNEDAAVDPTQPGEVCDPHNLNDSICAAFYPEQVILNMTAAPRAREPLASMSSEDKLALAEAACAALKNGETAETASLIETTPLPGDPEPSANRNNFIVFAAAPLAYCNEHADQRTQQLLAHYKSRGESASKEEFKDGMMPAL